MVTNFQSLLRRDLESLGAEINQFKSAELIWTTNEYFKNSAGHLCLHICGNLRHFIGHILGNTDFVRDRKHEFEGSSICTEELLQLINTTKNEIDTSLEKLSEQDLHSSYPLKVFGYEMSTSYFLIHLTGHLNYHLGQINHIRKSFLSN